MKKTLQKIASKNKLQLIGAQPLSGGDINQVFLLKCKQGSYVAKLNDASKFPGMFAAEAKGLALLQTSKSFKIPEVISFGTIENTSYLLMAYIESGNPVKTFWQRFAHHLAKLHKTTNSDFGLDHSNYIGSLPQQNGSCSSASEFYITQRLMPQFKMALERGLSFQDLERFYKNISEEIPNEPPALVHGDLWNGNYLVSEKNEPVLIDPAVAFAPREMDIGMMQLFGGFPEEVFSEYNSLFPLADGWKARIPLWQLYYLLVHLNLFGSSYLPQVNSVIKKYS